MANQKLKTWEKNGMVEFLVMNNFVSCSMNVMDLTLAGNLSIQV